MKKYLSLVLLLCGYCFSIFAKDMRTPLDVVSSIGDKLIKTTPFKNRLIVAPNREAFSDLKFINFKRAFGKYESAYAYAVTSVNAAEECTIAVQLTHNDECVVWLNGQEIYHKTNASKVILSHEERSIELNEKLTLSLNKGPNLLFIQLKTLGEDWIFYLQPEPDKGAVAIKKQPEIRLTLSDFPDVDQRITSLSSWLLCGPFEKEKEGFYQEFNNKWGEMYSSAYMGQVSWTLPKVEIWGDVIDAAPWGTNYNWNYHNGGVAWAMYKLAEVSGNEAYLQYADRFCNYHLDNLPFVKYQVRELNAFNCANHHIYETPLLDFTLAPSLPFIYALNSRGFFKERERYAKFIETMLEYEKMQIRLPGSSAYTRLTPEKYTTWVDDMFMGIPFLVQAASFTGDKAFLADAVQQVIDFNKVVWDKENNLYMHAGYSERPTVKLPHWSRANGWGIWATTEVLMNLSKKDSRYKLILNHFQAHARSLAKYQNENGFWYNVLEYPQSREEVSGTAIFTMAIARGIRLGWLDKKEFLPVVRKSWEALKTQIHADGTVDNICYGTMCSEDVDYYCKRPFYTDDTHGLFAVLFAGIEMHLIEEKLKKQ